MKKIASVIFCLALAMVASADVLYWQVANGDGSMSTEMQNYTYAKIYATKDGGDTRIALTSFFGPEDTDPVSSVYKSELTDNGGFYANLADIADGSYTSYSFAIEIYDGSDNVLGHTGWATNSSLQDYIVQKSDFNSNWQMMTAGFGTEKWSDGAAPVPEPTSGLLFLIGAALMGLRRRKVA